jgi:hypothetical protein
MVSERELSLFLNRNPHIDLREEITELKSEIVELCQRISDISYECYVNYYSYLIIYLDSKKRKIVPN